MNTEITDYTVSKDWLCYDANCPFCVGLAEQFKGVLASRRFELVPLQEPRVRKRLGLVEAELVTEMRLLKSDGENFGGADALLEIGRHFWWAWPVRQIGRIPAAMKLLRAGYRWVARQRGCAGGVCTIGGATHPAVKKRNWLGDILPLLILPMLASLCRAELVPWMFMWVMAFALYAGCKWLTYRMAINTRGEPDGFIKYGYLLAWPGMNAVEFFNRDLAPTKPRLTEWGVAAAKTALGIFLLEVIARLALPMYPLLAGWTGMIGIVFIIHFGAFHLLSLAWRQTGVKATPLMQNPLRAKSLADFWGGRWNTAFNELAFRFIFRAVRHRTTQPVAALVVFGLSGIIHELVVSLPARGGYGLPTLYFLVQGMGLIAERSHWGKTLGLGRGLRGWFFTLLITAGPAFWLFHPPFLHHVILPMLTAIGAT